MSNAMEVIVINCDKDAAHLIGTEINALPDSRSHITERKNMDGSAAGWIAFATLAINALPQVLDFIVKIMERNKVHSIKIGELEIQNPSRADVEDLKRSYLHRANQE